MERLLGLSEKLEMELNNLTNQITKLWTDCAIARLPEEVCDGIPTVSYTVTVNYSVVRSVCAVVLVTIVLCLCGNCGVLIFINFVVTWLFAKPVR